MARRKLRVDMDEILDAMTRSEQDPLRYVLDLETGKIETRFQPDLLADIDEEDEFEQRFEEDPDRYEEIPRYEGHEEYDLMCRFADSVDEDGIGELLAVALRGKGAFGRFPRRGAALPGPGGALVCDAITTPGATVSQP